MLKRKSFFDKMYQICCEKSLQISYWGWETVNYLGFAAKSFLWEREAGKWGSGVVGRTKLPFA